MLILLLSVIIFGSCSYKKRITAEDIIVSPYFSSNMVFQKGMPIRITGQCSTLGVLAVKIENVLKYATANSSGKWEVTFPAVDYSGTFSITIEGADESIEFNNVAVGKVWTIIGNAWLNNDFENYNDEILIGIQNNNVRYFQPKIDFKQTTSLEGEWKSLKREQINVYEHFCQLIGEELSESEEDVIGIVNLTWPGLNVSDFQVEAFNGVDSLWTEYFKQQQLYKQIADSSFRGIEKGVLDRRLDDWDWNETEFPIIAQKRWYLKNRTIWLRKKVYVPEKFIDSDFILKFGTIRGQFDFYFNGIYMGAFIGEREDYNLTIPDTVVKVWTNQITIRMVTGDSLTGFYSTNPEITNVNSTYRRDITEEWLYRTYLEQRLPNVTESDSLFIPITVNILDKLNKIDAEGLIIAGGYQFFNAKNNTNELATGALQRLDELINAKYKYLFLVPKPGVVDSIVNNELYNSVRNIQLEVAAKNGYRIINTLDISPELDQQGFYQGLTERFREIQFEQ